MATTYQDPVSWPFLPVPTADGLLAYPTLERSVRDAIRIILTTRPGEQLMRPRFGAGLQSFLDDGNTLALRRQIQTAIQSGLQNYESRIIVDRIDVDTVDGAPSEVQVQIYYRILRTNVTQQISATIRPT